MISLSERTLINSGRNDRGRGSERSKMDALRARRFAPSRYAVDRYQKLRRIGAKESGHRVAGVVLRDNAESGRGSMIVDEHHLILLDEAIAQQQSALTALKARRQRLQNLAASEDRSQRDPAAQALERLALYFAAAESK